MMSEVERIYQSSEDAGAFVRGYLENLEAVLRSLDVDAITRVIDRLLEALRLDQAVYILGNGGSAATASHLANDLLAATRGSERALRVWSLSANAATLTAAANDLGYEQVFVEQLRGRLRPGDLVLAISASGNSPNVLRAVEYANEHGAVTVGFSGFDGGRLAAMVSDGVHVSTPAGDYGPVEDVHMVLDHVIGNYLRLRCRAALEAIGAA